MKRSTLLSACLLVLILAAGLAQADLLLVKQGQPVGALVAVGEDPEVKQAAEALQAYIQRMSGARLRLQQVSAGPDGQIRYRAPAVAERVIVLCLPQHLAALQAPAEVKALAAQVRADGFALYSEGRSRLFITAPQPIGVVYGAYEVLERLGCRWYFPGELGEEIPIKADLFLPALAEAQSPDMVDRNMWYAYGGRPEWQSGGYRLWQMRNKMGGVRFSAGHNLMRVVPPARYGATNPEYFPMFGDKRHVPSATEGHNWQPCTSNPEVIALAVAAADKYFTENPNSASFSLSPNDGYGWCQCPQCLAQDPPEQRKQRNQYKGRRTLLFVNAVAREIARKHPGKYLAWYAYAGTVEPPEDVRAEPNVLTALAHYGYVGCNVHAMADPACPNNQKFLTLMDGWSKAADHLMIREYWSLLCGQADAMARVCAGYSLAEDIPLLVQRGFIAASAESEPEYGSSALNFYLAAKLMWNSRQPLEPLLVDYYQGMYGPAAGPMREFFEGIVTLCRQRSHRGHFFEQSDYTRMAADLERIQGLAATARQRERIQMTRDFLQFTTLLYQYDRKPTRELRDQINALADGVEANQQFTLDFVMHRSQFGRRHKAAEITNPEEYRVGPTRLVTTTGVLSEKARKLSPIARGKHVFALCLQPGEKLSGEVHLRRLGRYTFPATWVMVDEAGKTVAKGEANMEESSPFTVAEAPPGTYTLIADASSNACSVVSPVRGLALAGRQFALLGSQPPLYFYVPPGTASFWIQLETDAPGETGKLQVLNPEGKVVGEGETVADGQVQVKVEVAAAEAGQIWSLRLGAASAGILEDLRVGLSESLPPFLSTDPARVLIAQ